MRVIMRKRRWGVVWHQRRARLNLFFTTSAMMYAALTPTSWIWRAEKNLFGRQSYSIKRSDTGTKGGIEDIFTHFRVLWWRTPWNGKILILLQRLQHKRCIATAKKPLDVGKSTVWRAPRTVHLFVCQKVRTEQRWWNIWLHTRHKEAKGLGGRSRNCWFERREVGRGVCCKQLHTL